MDGDKETGVEQKSWEAGAALSQRKQPPKQPNPPKGHRPHFTKGYGVDRKATEGILPWSFVTERMASSRNYWVATTRPDGRPHAAPVWGLWFEDRFYFGTDPRSVKGRNLGKNPSMMVHLESGDEVVILEGAAGLLDDPPLLRRLVDEYDAKYKVRPAGFYYMDVSKAFAWREKDFTTSATRWVFKETKRRSSR